MPAGRAHRGALARFALGAQGGLGGGIDLAEDPFRCEQELTCSEGGLQVVAVADLLESVSGAVAELAVGLSYALLPGPC